MADIDRPKNWDHVSSCTIELNVRKAHPRRWTGDIASASLVKHTNTYGERKISWCDQTIFYTDHILACLYLLKWLFHFDPTPRSSATSLSLWLWGMNLTSSHQLIPACLFEATTSMLEVLKSKARVPGRYAASRLPFYGRLSPMMRMPGPISSRSFYTLAAQYPYPAHLSRHEVGIPQTTQGQ